MPGRSSGGSGAPCHRASHRCWALRSSQRLYAIRRRTCSGSVICLSPGECRRDTRGPRPDRARPAPGPYHMFLTDRSATAIRWGVARPKEFERDVVLDRAMQVFWSRGYEATSIQHLVGRMGIQRGSLYDTFGDKRRLFFAAVDRYDQVVTAKLLAALEEPASGKDAIRKFFRLKLKLSVEPGRPRGCLVTNSAAELASRDRSPATRVG